MCMGGAKICDCNLNREMKNATPGNRYLRKSRAWKRVAAAIALPASVVTIIGIYGCSAKFENGEVTFTPECWTLVSLAAVAEWTLSWCWVIFLGTMFYDAFHMDYTIRLLLSQPRLTSKARTFDLKFWRRTEKTEKDGADLQKEPDVEIAQTLEESAEERAALYPRKLVVNSGSLEEQRQARSDDEADELEADLGTLGRPRSMVDSRRNFW
ncbi:hypothetical protein H2200_002481 [Cladophialophora chaetospira]|uniref:CWH43-like N-terminal domain-containing protein n=1 Tax=Cladophialophora chaetospira TaxID=386627 RepID=A0AA39CNL5_9EURO|nr:hypothetical protein H2200_002481 [Cladophialophora chaetospira]